MQKQLVPFSSAAQGACTDGWLFPASGANAEQDTLGCGVVVRWE